MKRIMLIISILFCSKLIVAQETISYQSFVNYIDSIKTEYSVKKFTNSVNVKLPYNYREYFSELSEEEQNKVLDYVSEFYNQTEYLGLFGLAGVLLDEYYGYSKDNIKRRMIEINFDKISYMSFEVIDFGNSKYYTQHSRDRLLDIIEKRWSEEDMKAWTIFIKQTLNLNSYERDIQKIMKETNRQGVEVENFLMDSLIQKGVEKNLQANINRPIYERCIMMIGSLNDQRFVPALENMLEEYKDHKDYPEIKKACTYALAKLGVQKYIAEILLRDTDIEYDYLGTKEAFLRWLEINRDWNEWISIGSRSSLPAPIVSLWWAQDHIKNEIPKELRIKPMELEHFCLPDWKNCDSIKIENSKLVVQKLEKLYQWFFENKDILELPPANDRF